MFRPAVAFLALTTFAATVVHADNCCYDARETHEVRRCSSLPFIPQLDRQVVLGTRGRANGRNATGSHPSRERCAPSLSLDSPSFIAMGGRVI